LQRDLRDLEEAGIPLWADNQGRHGITAGYYIPPVHFTLEEAGVLYLAVRLLARYSDEHNPLIVQALAKLAGVLPEAIAGHIHHTIRALTYRPDNRTLAEVFEVILRGWATGRKVRIWHQAAGSDNVHEYILCPYFLEPSGTGFSTYVIGYCDWFDDLHTFKVERILAAQLTQETFEIPEDLDGAALLANAWGVMYGPVGEEVEVALRFSPQVARRVKESIWHPSQRLEECADGGCVLKVRVAQPLEMKPWIRGWGPDCQVLAPEWLRKEVAEEIRRAAEGYGVGGEQASGQMR